MKMVTVKRTMQEMRDLIARSTTPDQRKRDIRTLRRSGLFFPDWYLHTYPDVAEAGSEPLRHFYRFGAEELRNPSPFFDTTHYLTNNVDVRLANINPLLHYVTHGYLEGRSPNDWFQPAIHLASDYGVTSGRNPLADYIDRLADLAPARSVLAAGLAGIGSTLAARHAKRP